MDAKPYRTGLRIVSALFLGLALTAPRVAANPILVWNGNSVEYIRPPLWSYAIYDMLAYATSDWAAYTANDVSFAGVGQPNLVVEYSYNGSPWTPLPQAPAPRIVLTRTGADQLRVRLVGPGTPIGTPFNYLLGLDSNEVNEPSPPAMFVPRFYRFYRYGSDYNAMEVVVDFSMNADMDRIRELTVSAQFVNQAKEVYTSYFTGFVLPEPDVSVTARLKLVPAPHTEGVNIDVFPSFPAGTAPNNYAPGYPGQEFIIIGEAEDTGTAGAIDAMRAREAGVDLERRDYAVRRKTSMEEWHRPSAPGGGQLEAHAYARYIWIGEHWVESNPVYADAWHLEPTPIPPAQQVMWPEAPAGRQDLPWEIQQPWHDPRGGNTPEWVPYGLEFEQAQFLMQRWEWIHPVKTDFDGAPLKAWVVPDEFRLPRPTAPLSPEETLDTAVYPSAISANALGESWPGPMFLRARSRWEPGIRAEPPAARLGTVKLDWDTDNVEVEANWRTDQDLPGSVFAVSWRNKYSVEEMPELPPEFVTQGWRRNPNTLPPAGTTTFTATRSDGFTITDFDPTDRLDAGVYRVSAVYTPAVGEHYGPYTVNYTLRVNPRITINVGMFTEPSGQVPSATIDRWNPATSTWDPVSVPYSTWERTDREVRLRATPGHYLGWGTDWSTAPIVWEIVIPDTAWINRTDPNPIFNWPNGANEITLVAGAHRIAPQVTWLQLTDVNRRSSTTGMNAPWFFVGRPGVGIRAISRSRESGIARIEAQGLPAGADPTTGWVPLTVYEVPPAGQVAATPVESLFALKIGDTRADRGDTNPGAVFVVAADHIPWGSLPPDSKPYQIRVRAQEIAETARWSDWYQITVNAMLPIQRRAAAVQAIAPQIPDGAREWLTPSEGNLAEYLIWIW